jgi:hypothetical protein
MITMLTMRVIGHHGFAPWLPSITMQQLHAGAQLIFGMRRPHPDHACSMLGE